MDQRAGELNRKKNPSLAKKYADCVFIEKVLVNYNLRRKSSDMGSTATVIQFPIRLAHANTAHKFQGQTVPYPETVVMNINSVFEAGQAYVMLSRIQCMEQLFILKGLDPSKIRASPSALNELKRLKDISFNTNPSPWHENSDTAIKIASLNCAGLVPHLQDIRKDSKLLNAKVIHLVETSLSPDAETENMNIDGFHGSFTNVGNGKGLVTYVQDDCQCVYEKDDISQTLQITKFYVGTVATISVYRSSNHSIEDTCKKLKSIIDEDRTILISGDFSICTANNRSNKVTKMLEKIGFKLLTREATQIMGGDIDHIYWRNRSKDMELPTVERYSPYYSDHDGLLVTLRRKIK